MHGRPADGGAGTRAQDRDAHIIRNAGGIVTGDTLRSLLISHYLLGTQEFMIINHTDCGMLTFRDEELRAKLREMRGATAVVPARFFPFSDVEDNVREQLQKVRSHPWVPNDIPVLAGSSTRCELAG